MPKAKMRLVIECEMELDPENYDKGATIEDMFSVEKENVIDDPYLYFDIMSSNGGTVDFSISEVE